MTSDQLPDQTSTAMTSRNDEPDSAPSDCLLVETLLGHDGDQQDLADRNSLRRVAGMSTELADISEVEYRQLLLERVVLVSVWTTGSEVDAENAIAELKLLAETAGSQVLEGLIQRRTRPDPSTYIGRGKVTELREVVVATGADTVICDGELAPGSAAQPRGSDQGQGDRPDRADPGHLRRSMPRAPKARPRSSWLSCST